MHSKRAFVTFASFREYAAFRAGKTGGAASTMESAILESAILVLRRNARQAHTSTARLVCNGEGSPHAESKR